MGTSALRLPLGAKGSALRGSLDGACQAPRSVSRDTRQRNRRACSSVPAALGPDPDGQRPEGRGTPPPPDPRKPLRRTDEDGGRRVLKRSDFVSPLTFCLHVFLSTIPTPLWAEPRRLPRHVQRTVTQGRASQSESQEGRRRGGQGEVLQVTRKGPPSAPRTVSPAGLPEVPASAQTARSRDKTGPAPHIIQDT